MDLRIRAVDGRRPVKIEGEIRGSGLPSARTGLWVAVASATLVVVMALVQVERTPPGPLSAVHGSIPELAGPNSCSACHGGWFQSMASACLDCHGAVAEHIETGRGLHGLLGARAKDCAECHGEHHGTGFTPVNRLSFAKAGVPDPSQFDHSRLGFHMEGRHLELDCSACHANAHVDVLPHGSHRFFGLEANCASCHEDPHAGAMQRSCTECHDQHGFDRPHSLGHERHLPLIGGHAELNCRVCHGENTKHALERQRPGGRGPEMRNCLDCHDSPHGLPFGSGAARRFGLSLEASCAACHEHAHTSFRDPNLTLDPDLHALGGFRLEAPHDRLDCSACHDPQLEDFAARHPGRQQLACIDCHGDPHGGQFATGPFAQEGCVGCHATTHFAPHLFGVEHHGRTTMPLSDSHLAVSCEACHQQAHADLPRRFRGTSNQCADCHADAHSGFFDGRLAEISSEMRAPQGACAECHDPTRFSEVPHGRFDHGHWTGFPLTGAHEQEGCFACHTPKSEPDTARRRFGRVAQRFGALPAMHGGAEVGQSCAVCHTDPHGGRFDGPHLPTRFFDREGCARCHGETSFRELPHGFDHALWTGFALVGAHAQASCTDCHTPLAGVERGELSLGPPRGNACADCHVDPHLGQFAREPLTPGGAPRAADCARCHDAARDFASLTFDHDWDSRFRLDGAHRELDCSACHMPTVISGRETIRYKPLGSACTDCHGVGSGSLRRFGGGR